MSFPEDYIQENYERIMEKVKASKIFGEQTNEYDIRHLVLAAYYAGLFEGQDNCLKFFEKKLEEWK